MAEYGGYIYFLSNHTNSVLYVGVTSNLYSRIWEHKKNEGSNFTRRYHLRKLVYYEFHPRIEEAIQREKNIKKWKRKWKENLVNSVNPDWGDLWEQTKDMI